MVCKHMCEWFPCYYLICFLMVVKLQKVFAVTEPDLAISIKYALTGSWSEIHYKMTYGLHKGSDRNSKWEHEVNKNMDGWELNVAFKAWTAQATNLSANSNATFKCFHACNRVLPSYSALLWSASNNYGINRIKESCNSFDANKFCVTADWPGAQQFVLGYFPNLGGMEEKEDMTIVLARDDPMLGGDSALVTGNHFTDPPPYRYMYDPSSYKSSSFLNASFNRWEILDTFFAERLGGTICLGGYELIDATGKCKSCQTGYWRDIFQRNESLKCTPCQNDSSNLAPGGVGSPQCLCDAGYKDAGSPRRRRGVKVCEACSAGRFSSSRLVKEMQTSEECRPCQKGFFSNKSGSERCVACAVGLFAEKDGMSACEVCPAGRIAWAPGSYFCNMCGWGTISSAPGSTKCERCPLGRFADDPGMANCTDCDGGLSTAALGAVEATECICPAGAFLTQLEPEMMCSECLEGMICEADSVSWDLLGNEAFQGRIPKHPQLKPGFMVKQGDKDTMVYRCTDEEVCPGGEVGECGLGRDPQSIGCAECPSRFYVGSEDECKPCLGDEQADALASIVQVTVLAALGLAGVALLMAKQSRDKGVYMQSQNMTLLSDLWGIAKQLVNQLQIMGAFSAIRIEWPGDIKVMVSAWSNWSTSLMEFGKFGLSCAFPDFALKWVFECLVPLFVPLAGVALLVLAYPMRCFRAGSKGWVTLPKVVTATGFCCMVFYISASRKAIAPLECYSHPARTGQSSMTQHASVICGQGNHGWMLALGIFFCLLYPIGILAWFLSICYVAPARMVSKKSNSMQGLGSAYVHRFLFRDFRFECYWWAPVSMVRDLMVAFTCTFVPNHPVYQLQLDVLWLLLYFALCTFFWPYGDSGQSFLDTVRMCCALILLVGASYFAALSSDVDVDSTEVTEVNMAITFFACWLIAFGLVMLSISERLRPSYFEKKDIQRQQSIVEAIGLLNSVIDEMPHFLEGISTQNAKKLQLILHRGLRMTSVSSRVHYCVGHSMSLTADTSVEEDGVVQQALVPDVDAVADDKTAVAAVADDEYAVAADDNDGVVQIQVGPKFRSRLQL